MRGLRNLYLSFRPSLSTGDACLYPPSLGDAGVFPPSKGDACLFAPPRMMHMLSLRNPWVALTGKKGMSV